MHRRAVFYAFLALAVPLPALALTGGDESEVSGGPAASITVSASLDSCGTAAATIVCKIDATWNDVPGATRYSASVARADGSVVDYGDVGAGSGSFWVPYVGNGTYTVTVSAYGTLPGEDKPSVIAKGSSAAGGGRHRTETAESFTGAARPDTGADGESPDDGDGETPTGSEPPAEEPEEPSCEDPEPEEPPVDPPAEAPAAGAEGQPLSADATSALDRSAELPDSVECPEPEPEPAPTP